MAVGKRDLYAAYWFARNSTPEQVYIKLASKYPDLSPQEYDHHVLIGGLIVAAGRDLRDHPDGSTLAETVDPRLGDKGRWEVTWNVGYDTIGGSGRVAQGRTTYGADWTRSDIVQDIERRAFDLMVQDSPDKETPDRTTGYIQDAKIWDP